jgi:ABC-2 type transport system permease protein
MSIKRYIQAVRALAIAFIRRFFRDKTALFFTFLFPLLFLVVFGSLNRGNSDVSFNVAVISHAETQFAKEFAGQLREIDALKIDPTITSLKDAKEKMGRGEIESIIEIPKEFGAPGRSQIPGGSLKVYFEESSPQGGQTVAALMEGVLDGINQELVPVELPFSVSQVPTATSGLSSFDYIFSGLLGFTILSLGIFGLANSMPAEKKTGSYRRLRASPIGASQLVIANGIAYLVTGLISIGIMFIAALTIFDFNMRGDYLSLLLFSILGIISMFGFGLAIGGWAKNENQSAPLTNVIALPLMFLSGVFFPRFLMPEWLQVITGFLPLTPIVDGLRFITTEGQTLFQLGPQLLLMAVWTVLIYTLAFKIFRWE